MAFNYGYRGDVVNSIGVASAYPGGRTFGLLPAAPTRLGYRNNSFGELSGVNEGRDPVSTPSRNYMNGNGNGGGQQQADTTVVNTGPLGKPTHWWVMLLIVFTVFIWASRKYAPSGSERFGNIMPSLFNGVFLTLYIVLILNVLKVFATKYTVPGLSELILAA